MELRRTATKKDAAAPSKGNQLLIKANAETTHQ
jgi:hypothetical protein